MSDVERDAAARVAAAAVLRYYSTSFSWAVRLLDPGNRERIRAIYALVRTADEIVDTPGRNPGEALVELDEFEAQTVTALRTGHSANPVIQAFATTARQTTIDRALLHAFFTSMRTDLGRTEHDQESYNRYIYGSAEVVGLMCLRSFMVGTQLDYGDLAPGAQSLGAAFQKVNFLRDLASDRDQLGRHYLPEMTGEVMTTAERDLVVADIDDDLGAAARAIEKLPRRPRIAVRAAHGLFAELNRRLSLTPAAELNTARIRVPNPVKARILLRSLAVPATRTRSRPRAAEPTRSVRRLRQRARR